MIYLRDKNDKNKNYEIENMVYRAIHQLLEKVSQVLVCDGRLQAHFQCEQTE